MEARFIEAGGRAGRGLGPWRLEFVSRKPTTPLPTTYVMEEREGGDRDDRGLFAASTPRGKRAWATFARYEMIRGGGGGGG